MLYNLYMETKIVENISDVNDFFPKFMFLDNKLNLIVKVKYFTKKCDYKKLSNYIFNLLDFTIQKRKEEFNIDVLDIFVDLKEYKIKEVDYSFIKFMISICQDKYKDSLRIVYLQNTNFMFKTIYAIVRPFIDKDTRKKIFFIKKDKKKKINEQDIDELFD